MTDASATDQDTAAATVTASDTADREDAWLLGDLADLPEVRFAVVFTSDGLVREHRGDVGTAAAERFAAAASSHLSVSRALMDVSSPGEAFDHGMCASAGHYMFVRSAALGDDGALTACLAVVTTTRVNLKLIGAAMAERVARPGDAAWFTSARG
ncbi:hypothetical protein G3I59_31340 [Amycolatopsis rubida]|uniref:Roadblock/LAMTOR2 domain-containing protein n=1 Tax=Amycolatopsis rubida TaxID=112413 RepID=A0ABX0BZN6_9PSEU|nr:MULTISPECIES: roadblock/LC7 domain-containing protein [Amycolatopsis]MYW94973.1 hypothetical protein [Amycolatopsis rubida]NEC59960.1 hypothetical protein [Amycolatopsis rubida]